MALSTYRDLFQAALEEWIAAGGDVSSVVTVVSAHQSHDPLARHFMFSDWLDAATFTCGRCGRRFSPRFDEVDEDDYVVCRRCAA